MIQFRKLSLSEIKEYFESVKDDFESFKDEGHIKAFSKKLSEYADFEIYTNEENKIGGMIAFYMNNGNFVYLTFVSVKKEFRSQKVFSRMLAALEKKANSKNYPRIRLEVRKKNLLAREVYEHSGFVIIEKTDESLYMEKKI